MEWLRNDSDYPEALVSASACRGVRLTEGQLLEDLIDHLLDLGSGLVWQVSMVDR